MRPGIVKAASGPAFGFEVGMRDLDQWAPTIVQMRDCIRSWHVTGPNFQDWEWEKAAMCAPSQREVENISEMAYEAVNTGRVIDFGHLPNDVMKDASRRGGPLYVGGAIGQPFRNVWIMYHTWEGGTGIYTIQLTELDKPAGGECEVVELVPLKVRNEPILMIGDRLLLSPEPEDAAENRYSARAIPSVWRFVPGMEEAMNNGSSPENAAGSNVLDPLMTGLLLLSTNGVDRRTVEPPAKLNKARAKSGKLPIPPYDVVDSGPYVTALLARRSRIKSDYQGGHHASPTPHLRRGHLRNLPSGLRTFVRDTLVGATDEARAAFTRSHYKADVRLDAIRGTRSG